jgi:parallel beta-helix repeat protein
MTTNCSAKQVGLNQEGILMTAMFRTMSRVMWCSMCALALALGPSMANEPYPSAKEVKCDEDESLQEELDNAEPGFIVLVKGTCYENVVIRTPGLLLVADPSFGPATIDGSGDPTRSAIVIVVSNVTVLNFTITGGRNGVVVSRAGSAVITNNRIIGNDRVGVFITRSSHGEIKGNTIEDNGFKGVIAVNRGHGIYVGRASSAEINDNTINHNGDVGVRVADSSHASLSDNIITNNEQEGLDVTLGSNVRLSDGSGGKSPFENYVQ